MNSIILHSPMEALWELDIKSDFSASQIQTCNDGGQEQTAPPAVFSAWIFHSHFQTDLIVLHGLYVP